MSLNHEELHHIETSITNIGRNARRYPPICNQNHSDSTSGRRNLAFTLSRFHPSIHPSAYFQFGNL